MFEALRATGLLYEFDKCISIVVRYWLCDNNATALQSLAASYPGRRQIWKARCEFCHFLGNLWQTYGLCYTDNFYTIVNYMAIVKGRTFGSNFLNVIYSLGHSLENSRYLEDFFQKTTEMLYSNHFSKAWVLWCNIYTGSIYTVFLENHISEL